jgi:hypothetical protein
LSALFIYSGFEVSFTIEKFDCMFLKKVLIAKDDIHHLVYFVVLLLNTRYLKGAKAPVIPVQNKNKAFIFYISLSLFPLSHSLSLPVSLSLPPSFFSLFLSLFG